MRLLPHRVEPWEFTLEFSEQFSRSDAGAGVMQEGYRLQLRLEPPSSSSERAPVTTGDAMLRLTNAEGVFQHSLQVANAQRLPG